MVTIEDFHDGRVGGRVSGDGQSTREHDSLAHLHLLVAIHGAVDILQLPQQNQREMILTAITTSIISLHNGVLRINHMHIYKVLLII